MDWAAILQSPPSAIARKASVHAGWRGSSGPTNQKCIRRRCTERSRGGPETNVPSVCDAISSVGSDTRCDSVALRIPRAERIRCNVDREIGAGMRGDRAADARRSQCHTYSHLPNPNRGALPTARPEIGESRNCFHLENPYDVKNTGRSVHPADAGAHPSNQCSRQAFSNRSKTVMGIFIGVMGLHFAHVLKRVSF